MLTTARFREIKTLDLLLMVIMLSEGTIVRTDAELRLEGTKALIQALGEVEAERYIALMSREKLDCTLWQRRLWADRSTDEISRAAMRNRDEADQ
jgi:hypothetical protein